jgi:hypothetical protein
MDKVRSYRVSATNPQTGETSSFNVFFVFDRNATLEHFTQTLHDQGHEGFVADSFEILHDSNF